MYLVDTDVVSNLRKGARSNAGVRRFFDEVRTGGSRLWLSVVTIGEIRRGVEMIRRRDVAQADVLERWLDVLTVDFADRLLPVDADVAQLWGRLRVPHHENSSDKLIAATALINGLTVVTGNRRHFEPIGVPFIDPFAEV